MSANHDVQTLPPDPERATLEGKNKFIGFWLFLGGETVLFATLFGTYLGLNRSVADGPGPGDLFHLDLVAIMTFILLTSSLTSVFATMAMKSNEYVKMQLWFGITVLLGLAFLGFEIYEFVAYVDQGLGFTTSGFSSAFYALVGFHGAHVLFGILWITTLMLQATKKRINLTTAPKFYLAGLYWHFVDVVWVFIFTVVYLMGIVGGGGH
ncbi:cytochrome c oxidase subunit 3 [Caldalkalibacillus salinus]|uniref:cytochrome c oxidase subunit 3 n=1 Tax=Caldalkalibacillus salinus TaxID=2803787 RepID=UPI00192314DC|nr:cytochrome c oxidase subunit 3 [Caldalkalibacillus salinus]